MGIQTITDNERSSLLGPSRRAAKTRDEEDGHRSCIFYQFHSSHIILVVVFLERASLYGITVNLVHFLNYGNYLHWSTSVATIATLLCVSLAKCGAAVTGYLADTRVGRLNMLLAALALQCAGAVCFMAAAFLEYCRVVDARVYEFIVVLALVLIAFSTAAAMGCEIPLGLDQYSLQMAHYSTARSFFPLYYFFVNIGALLAYTVISFVQYNFLFGIGFSIPVLCSLVNFSLLFCFRKHVHESVPDTNSPLLNVWRVVKEARRVKSKRSAGLNGIQSTQGNTDPVIHWVQYADSKHGGSFEHNQVANVQNFLAVLSVIFSTIFYQAIISQVSGSWEDVQKETQQLRAYL